MEHKLEVSRKFNAAISEVWKIWTEPEYIKQWWGPDKYTCPKVNLDFRIGQKTIVCMEAPKEFGGQIHYNTWNYTHIIHHERIEFIMHLSDENGTKLRPTDVGMPEDFPENIKTIITFNKINETETELIVTEYANFGVMSHFAKLGLEQSMNKAQSLFLV